jgi:hypothetical protein
MRGPARSACSSNSFVNVMKLTHADCLDTGADNCFVWMQNDRSRIYSLGKSKIPRPRLLSPKPQSKRKHLLLKIMTALAQILHAAVQGVVSDKMIGPRSRNAAGPERPETEMRERSREYQSGSTANAACVFPRCSSAGQLGTLFAARQT